MDPAAFHARFQQRARFAREVRASVEIDAPLGAVWSVLVDFERYGEWNPFTRKVEVDLAVGNEVVLHVDMPGRPRVVQREAVNYVERHVRICWGLIMGGPGLLTTNRYQDLEPLGPNRTRYVTYDEFSGWLVPLVFALYGTPMRLGFQRMADALKARCETLR